MRRKVAWIAIITLLVFALFLWSPWVNEQYAKERAVTAFERAWLNVADGCGFACHGCGATAVQKVIFGAQVTLEYACGLLPADSPENHQHTSVFVSFLGKVYGLPRP